MTPYRIPSFPDVRHNLDRFGPMGRGSVDLCPLNCAHLIIPVATYSVARSQTLPSVTVEQDMSRFKSILCVGVFIAILAWLFQVYPWPWYARQQDPPPVSYGNLRCVFMII